MKNVLFTCITLFASLITTQVWSVDENRVVAGQVLSSLVEKMTERNIRHNNNGTIQNIKLEVVSDKLYRSIFDLSERGNALFEPAGYQLEGSVEFPHLEDSTAQAHVYYGIDQENIFSICIAFVGINTGMLNDVTYIYYKRSDIVPNPFSVPLPII